MKREQLIVEKENLERNLALVNKLLASDESSELQLETYPWRNDLLWQIADIVRTSPIVNKNYPWGYDCGICELCGNECSTDGDGIDCNWAFMSYFERELIKIKERRIEEESAKKC